MKIDTYVWKARRTAILIAALPPALAAFAWFPHADWKLLAPVLTFFGMFALVAQLGRDKGKIKEPLLFQSWGGKPTTAMLRHRDSPFDPATLARLHEALAGISGVPAPSKRKEAANPDAADVVYEDYVRYVRDATRDKEKYPRIFDENVNYGFRRNLWGLKPLGITLAGAGAVAGAAAIYWHGIAEMPPIPVAATAVNLILFALWVFWINKSWVRITAQAYAERLLEVVHRLERPAERKMGPPQATQT
jgi:hypothetical protein